MRAQRWRGDPGTPYLPNFKENNTPHTTHHTPQTITHALRASAVADIYIYIYIYIYFGAPGAPRGSQGPQGLFFEPAGSKNQVRGRILTNFHLKRLKTIKNDVKIIKNHVFSLIFIDSHRFSLNFIDIRHIDIRYIDIRYIHMIYGYDILIFDISI